MRLRLLAVLALFARATAAQELEPRSYAASPIGTSFFVFAYARSYGSLLFDPTIPVDGVSGSVSYVTPAYGHVFAIGKVQALFTAAIPYAVSRFSGTYLVTGNDSTVDRTGVGDLRVKLSANLIGSPALTPAEFAKTPPRPLIVGASVAVVAPTGQYFANKGINIGTNRWAFKPEVGASYNWKAKFYLDLYAGVWLFAANQSFYPGTNIYTQDPLVSLQLHTSYTFFPRFFAALDGTWYGGGSTHVNGGPASVRTDNSRIGALVSYGFTQKQAVKLSWSYGASSRIGSDYTTWTLVYQVLWF